MGQLVSGEQHSLLRLSVYPDVSSGDGHTNLVCMMITREGDSDDSLERENPE